MNIEGEPKIFFTENKKKSKINQKDDFKNNTAKVDLSEL